MPFRRGTFLFLYLAYLFYFILANFTYLEKIYFLRLVKNLHQITFVKEKVSL